MKHQTDSAAYFHSPDLSELTTGLLQKMPAVVATNSLFINEMPSKLVLNTDSSLVATVLNGMLSSVIEDAKETYVRLSAKVYGHVVLVHITKEGRFNNSSLQSDMSHLNTMAERILGTVSVNSERKDVSTLTFGFPNLPPLD